MIFRMKTDREEERRRTEAAALVTEAIRMRVALLTEQLHAELERLSELLAEQTTLEGVNHDG